QASACATALASTWRAAALTRQPITTGTATAMANTLASIKASRVLTSRFTGRIVPCVSTRAAWHAAHYLTEASVGAPRKGAARPGRLAPDHLAFGLARGLDHVRVPRRMQARLEGVVDRQPERGADELRQHEARRARRRDAGEAV